MNNSVLLFLSAPNYSVSIYCVRIAYAHGISGLAFTLTHGRNLLHKFQSFPEDNKHRYCSQKGTVPIAAQITS